MKKGQNVHVWMNYLFKFSEGSASGKSPCLHVELLECLRVLSADVMYYTQSILCLIYAVDGLCVALACEFIEACMSASVCLLRAWVISVLFLQSVVGWYVCVLKPPRQHTWHTNTHSGQVMLWPFHAFAHNSLARTHSSSEEGCESALALTNVPGRSPATRAENELKMKMSCWRLVKRPHLWAPN